MYRYSTGLGSHPTSFCGSWRKGKIGAHGVWLPRFWASRSDTYQASTAVVSLRTMNDRLGLLLRLLLFLLLRAASVAAEAACQFEPLQPAYVNCYDTSTESDPCAACSAQSTAATLRYADYYHTTFTSVRGGSSSCEPAVAWVCPDADQGRCCVQRHELDATHWYRTLCAREDNSSDAGSSVSQANETAVDDALGGRPWQLPQTLITGSKIYLRGEWMQRWSNYTLVLMIGSNSSEACKIIFNRATKRVTMKTSSALVESELLVQSDAEYFSLLVELQWDRWQL